MVTCGFCGFEFEEDRTQSACRACPLGSDCGLVRCPRCGYENPGTPRWIAFLKKKLEKRTTASTRAPHKELRLPMLPLTRADARHRSASRGDDGRPLRSGVGAAAHGGGPVR
jgi:hypothetical protein